MFRYHTGIIDDHIDAIWVFALEESTKVLDAARLTDVHRTELDRGVSTILLQHLRLLELRIIVQDVDSFLTTLY